MRKFIILCIISIGLFALTACDSKETDASEKKEIKIDRKSVV